MQENFDPKKTGVFTRPNLEKQPPKFKPGTIISFRDAQIIIESTGSTGDDNKYAYAVRIEFPDGTAKDYKVTETGLIQAQNNIANLADTDNWEFVSDAGPKES